VIADPAFAPIRVRTASRDYEALVGLFVELYALHRQARPDFFQPFDGPARTRAEIEKWLAEPASTVWWRKARRACWVSPSC